MTSVLDLPPSDRPRERLRALGSQALTTTELLALLLGTGVGGRSAATSAEAILLARYDGSLRRLGQLPVATLTSVHGLGEGPALAVHAALELGRRLAAESRRRRRTACAAPAMSGATTVRP
jgi:DNA repair protein RadC